MLWKTCASTAPGPSYSSLQTGIDLQTADDMTHKHIPYGECLVLRCGHSRLVHPMYPRQFVLQHFICLIQLQTTWCQPEVGVYLDSAIQVALGNAQICGDSPVAFYMINSNVHSTSKHNPMHVLTSAAATCCPITSSGIALRRC